MRRMGSALKNLHIHVGWEGILLTLAVLLAMLFVRRLLPPDRRRRGRVHLVFLALSFLLRLAVGGLMTFEMSEAGTVVGFISILLLAFGMTGLIALVVFDISLPRVHVEVPSLVRDILQGLAFLVIIIFVLQGAGVNLFGLITTSAVLTAIIGLALQSTISNLFAGLSLQVDRTIGVGDWIHVGSRVGRIAEIKWRSTLLVTRDGDNVILPNAHLLQNEVLNYSKPTNKHRMTLKIGFGYRHAPNEVKRMLIDCARGAPGVLTEPAPDAFPVDFADSAVTYALRYWIDDVQREAPIEGEVRTRVWYAAQRENVEIPFPIRTVFMNQVSKSEADEEAEREVAERASVLARNELFRTLEPKELEILAREARTVRFAHGEIIIRQGDPGDSLYLVQRGDVVVRLAVEGAEREVATIHAGQFFGEMSLVTGEPRRATCAAKTDVLCHVVDHTALRQLLSERPTIADQVSLILGERQSQLEGERENLSAEARARRAAENSSKLLGRIRNFFNLG
jgi:small-conductance mechanosensitive channel/CRP-like cAMP-binding protein